MNWSEAIEAAMTSAVLRRESEMWMRVLESGNPALGGIAGAAIKETGREGFRLASAWTHDEKPVLVFQGAESKCLFVPESDDRNAVDWTVI